MFRFRHPPLPIAWPQMERLQTGRMLFVSTLTIHPRGVGTRIRLWGAPARAVEEAWREAAAAARPVPV